MENNLQHAFDWIVTKKLERLSSTSKRASFVYLISCGGFVKVGISGNPQRRLSLMQVCSPHKMKLLRAWRSDHADIEERNIHRLLEPYHHRGEWFKLPELLLSRLLKR
jgi:hypothetical protein